ncbi:hypothetical protein [Haloferula sp. BvORR071]|uniref:hypothetical protein n=1 Tax=Haloferula sp. BvORR071 TaxID=1396141 RepID=UPI000558E65C|nr:hypothetical protein [Haloferula sp. BvORR071]
MIRQAHQRLLLFLLLLLPSIAAAHPGHYHPDEDDEFAKLRSDYFHLHGYLEIGLVAVALAAMAVFRYHSNLRVKIGAVVAFGASLAMIAAL